MGQVRISVELANYSDIAAGRQVRSLVVREALMDTGATFLSLPAEIIAELGLPFARSIEIETATGIERLRLFRGAIVAFEDRDAIVDVLELPPGCKPLFGVTPMELLGIEPDSRAERVRRFPDGGRAYPRV